METHLDTYLSPYVHNLLVNLSCESSQEESARFLLNDLTIDWSTVSDVLGNLQGFNILEQPASWYESIVQRLWPVYHSIHSTFVKAGSCHHKQFFLLLEWTNLAERISSLYAEYTASKTEVSKLSLVLFLTSALERSLGNILSSIKAPVPFLLRDLLNTQELRNILGITPSTFIQLLVGTPRGLNLRNVTWHGFIHPTEISESLVTALIITIASIGIILKNHGTPVCSRGFLKLSKFDSVLMKSQNNLFQAVHLRSLVDSSEIIPSAFKSLWTRALDFSDQSRYGECCMILLPQIEFLLRCAFCEANNCHSRLLTAEAEILYTTMDHILLPTLENEDAEENKLYKILTIDVITMINDLLTFSHGPRLRDKLSHGEIKLEDVSSHLNNHIIHVSVNIILRLNSYFQISGFDSMVESENTHLNFDIKSVEYYPKFHLISVVERSISKAIQELKDWAEPQLPEGFILPQPVASDLESDLNSFLKAVETRNSTIELDKLSFKLLDDFSQLKVSSYDCSIFKNREFMAYLMQIAEKSCEILDNVKLTLREKYLQWKEFKLRERGRNNYSKILQVSPILRLCLLSILYLVILNFNAASHSMSTPNLLSDMKAVLSAIQNMHHYTNSSVNRWLEIINMTRNIICPVLKQTKIETIRSIISDN